ncbi:hypothetical protein HID58_064800 [Brassica napus]|uniref:Uncharacterized protein n=1 Tax=Brassica napus TaxID=3708 RepID=A0ABQ7ZB11_BRANA|nr:hypothetical protein HID58_064800 [Brassica napus]
MRQEDARYILNIRLSSTMRQDTPVWNYTSTGKYSVKSGWGLWKMRNNLVFQRKREHIVKVIYDAVSDFEQWEEEGEKMRRKGQTRQDEETVPPCTQYYCYVDAFWKDDKEVAGVVRQILREKQKRKRYTWL